MLELSEKNADYYIQEGRRKKLLHIEEQTFEDRSEMLKQLQEDLQLPVYPSQIECFDNSNFQGSYPVAAMVYFKEGQPDKSQYRKFNIKTVQGINDFGSMKEIVARRYRRLLADNSPLPQLIIIDGGKGQLNAAMDALKEVGMDGKATVVGLAKNVEEIFFPGDKESVKLPFNSESLHLVRRIRDEVHRFGITFHRNQRSRGTFVNELEQIKGIGKATADVLLKKYKSVKKIKEISFQDMEELVGKSKAAIIQNYFKNKEGGEKKEGQDENPAL